VLTWVSFPGGRRIAADFSGTLRVGQIVIIDAVEYVIENVGQIAAEQTPKSQRYGKVRQFVPIVYLKARAGSERGGTHATPIGDARSRVA
jgi:hypothetical protein